MRLSYLLSLSALFSSVWASNVLELDSTNFDEHIGKDAPALVEFFAPWCGHCKNLAPIYEQLADAYAHAKGKVIVAKVDADGAGREAGSRFGVTGFPTLKWFPAGSLTPEDYSGGRDLDTLLAFITEKSGVKSNIKPPPPPATVQLNAWDFDEVVMDPEKDVLVAFTAPWCGHCKSMKPTLETVAQNFASESSCVIAQMDADAEPNKPIAARYEVRSFPTIKFFPKGSSDKQAIPYETGRSEGQFVEFLNEHCGTQRAVGGGLSDLAGRVPDLDTIASQFYSSAPDRASLLEQATALAASLDPIKKASGEYYLKAMSKMNDSTEWLTKESSRLASMLSKKTLAPFKLDEIKRKSNILAAFLGEKAAEAGESATDAAKSATSMAADAGASVQAGAAGIVDGAQEGGQKILKQATDSAGSAYGAASAAATDVSSSAAAAAASATNSASSVYSSVADAATDAAGHASKSAADGASAVSGSASSVYSQASAAAGYASKSAADGASAASGSASSVYSQASAAATGAAGKAGEYVADAAAAAAGVVEGAAAAASEKARTSKEEL